MTKLRVAINGFGRIGRNVTKCLLEKYPQEVEIVGINDLTDAATLAHLFTYDSFFGVYDKPVAHDEASITVGGMRMPVFAQKDPTALPWKDLQVDVVLECTGLFLTKEEAQKHIDAGARKVVMSAPPKDDTPVYMLGVNDKDYQGEAILSNASCTTNALAPLVHILHEAYGIRTGMMNTTHSFTQDQRLQDAPHKDLRRARSATLSIIPTSTGAAKTVAKIIPALQGKLNGHSFRVPTQDVSIVDFVCDVERAPASAEAVNKLIRSYADGAMRGIIAVNDLPLVSVDFKKNAHSSILDSELTMVLGNQIKVVAWYDNEWGYSMRLADMCVLAAKK